MGETDVVSLQDPGRVVDAHRTSRLTDNDLRATQRVVHHSECHAVLDRLSYQIRTRVKRYTIFHDLSVGFPKGRRIVLYGHKGSGKTTLLELILGERAPTRGKVVVNSRLSWPVHVAAYFDHRLSIRQNLMFTGRVLGLDCERLIALAQQFCDFNRKALEEPLQVLSAPIRRRLGALVVLAQRFDCLIMDAPMKGILFGLKGSQAEAFEEMMLDRDYILAASGPPHRPPNADLAYILYEGRLYMFDDVDRATRIFARLPEPPPAAGHRAPGGDEMDMEEHREEGF